jgi:hypothetical protein
MKIGFIILHLKDIPGRGLLSECPTVYFPKFKIFSASYSLFCEVGR